MEKEEVQRSIRYLPPHEGESISHYLGRWMRKESVSIAKSSALSRQLKLGTTLGRWERFYFNPPASEDELVILGGDDGFGGGEIAIVVSPEGEAIKAEPIRLCAACYTEMPYHRMQWQFQSTAGCEHHRLRLPSRCPGCGERFPMPSQWSKGKCKKCGMLFKSMAKWQKGC